jgi:hypothetical protein
MLFQQPLTFGVVVEVLAGQTVLPAAMVVVQDSL